jgi:hypothetical protein
MFHHIIFVLLQCFSHVFFFKIIFVEFFFNIELVENLALIFLTCFFFLFFFYYFAFFSPKLSSFLFLFFCVLFLELFLLILFF